MRESLSWKSSFGDHKTQASEHSLTIMGETEDGDESGDRDGNGDGDGDGNRDDEAVPPDAKAAIAGAVRRALAEHGYARLTTAKIAAEYENSEAGLYYYYDSKDGMIAAFLDHAAAEFAADLPDAGASAEVPRASREQRQESAATHRFPETGARSSVNLPLGREVSAALGRTPPPAVARGATVCEARSPHGVVGVMPPDALRRDDGRQAEPAQ
jgi:AcrR family transcriptional regulator